MKRLRLILASFLILFLLLVACLLLVNQWLLPQKARPFLLQQVQEKTGLLPEIRSLSFQPWKGFVLSDIRLYDPQQKEKPFIQAEALSFRILWAPFLLNRQIILSDFSLQKPHLFLKRDKQGHWNGQNLFEQKEKAPAPPLVSHMSIREGTVDVVDETPNAFHRTLTPLRLDVSFRLPDQLSFKGRSGVSDFPTEISVDGNYSFIQKELSGNLELRQITDRLIQPYLASLPFTVTEGKGDLRCHLSLDRNQTLSLQKIHYEGALALRQEAWQSAGKVALDGFFTLWPKEPPETDYFFTLLLKEGTFQGSALPSPVQQLEGKLVVKKGLFTLEALKGVWSGQSFTAHGSLQTVQEPSLDLQVEATLDLPSLQMLPSAAPLLKYGRALSGKGSLQWTLRGPLGKGLPLDYAALGRLEHTSLKLDAMTQPIEEVRGTFSVRPGQFLLQDVEGFYDKEPFRLKAGLDDFQHPQLSLTLSHRGQEIEAQFRVSGEDLQPFHAALRRGATDISFEGAVNHYRDPSIDGTLNVKGPLQELTSLLPQAKPQVEQLHLKGDLNGQFQVNGPLKKPEQLSLQGTVTLPRLSFKELSFKEIETRLRYADQKIVLSDLTAQAYGGTVAGTFSRGLSDPFPFTIQTEFRGIQLERLLPTVSHRMRKVEGTLNGKLLLDGEAANTGTIVGDGSFEIRDGNLYQAPILKGLFGAWGPIVGTLYPELDEWVVLKEAAATCHIANRAIRTEDFQVTGDRLILYASGQIDFDQTLGFDVWLRFTDPAIIERGSNLSKLKNILVDETGMLGGKVTVKGTLSNPKFRYKSLPMTQIRELFKGAADILLPKIFGEK